MADALAEKCSSLSILEAEQEEALDLSEVADDSDGKEGEYLLLGKVLSIRSYNFEAMKKTITEAWGLAKKVTFAPIENDLFVVQFLYERDKERVLKNGPWNFANKLLLLMNFDYTMQPNDIQINECPFWIRLYNLPFNCQSERAVRAVAGRLGQVMEVEASKVCWDRSRKVRVLIDVRKPLRASVKAIDTAGKECLITIKYERLPFFCFVCGLLDHTEKDCNNVAEEDLGERRRWGSWIRASPRRGRGRLIEEVESFEALKAANSGMARRGLQFGGESSRKGEDGGSSPLLLRLWGEGRVAGEWKSRGWGRRVEGMEGLSVQGGMRVQQYRGAAGGRRGSGQGKNQGMGIRSCCRGSWNRRWRRWGVEQGAEGFIGYVGGVNGGRGGRERRWVRERRWIWRLIIWG